MVATARNEGSSLGIESITILPRGSVISRDPKRRAADSGDDRRARKRRRALTGPGADEGVVGAQFKLVAGKARDADEDEDEDDEVYLEITSQRSPSGSGRARTMVYDRRVPIEVEMATRRRAPPPPARVPSPARSQEVRVIRTPALRGQGLTRLAAVATTVRPSTAMARAPTRTRRTISSRARPATPHAIRGAVARASPRRAFIRSSDVTTSSL